MNFIDKFELFLFDLDGVLYIDDKPTPKAAETVNTIIRQGKKVLFLTNNPARSKNEYRIKLKQMGIIVSGSQILTSTDAICRYLVTKINNINNKTAFVIGSSYFKSRVRKTGIRIDNGRKFHVRDYVIMGGHREFNFDEINRATILIRKGAKFIATNHEFFYPTKEGFSPATGALVASIEAASGQHAVITGKPERYIFDLSLEVAEIKNKKKTVIIGDNLNTDIMGGYNFEITTILCLTGVTSIKNLLESSIKPDLIINDLSYLLKR